MYTVICLGKCVFFSHDVAIFQDDNILTREWFHEQTMESDSLYCLYPKHSYTFTYTQCLQLGCSDPRTAETIQSQNVTLNLFSVYLSGCFFFNSLIHRIFSILFCVVTNHHIDLIVQAGTNSVLSFRGGVYLCCWHRLLR